MASVEIYIAAILGAFLQIWQMDGYKLGIFYENGQLQMGVIMSFVTGIIAVILAIQTGYAGFETVVGAFATAFMVPFAIDKFVTKSPIGNATIEE